MDDKLKKAIEMTVEKGMGISGLTAEQAVEIAELVCIDVIDHMLETEPQATRDIGALRSAKGTLALLQD